MSIELTIPEVGESIQEVQIGRWLKQPGDAIEQDEDIVELETDKASVDLPAPAAGVLTEILKHEGDTVAIGDVVALIEEQTPRQKNEEPATQESIEHVPETGVVRSPHKEVNIAYAEADRPQSQEPPGNRPAGGNQRDQASGRSTDQAARQDLPTAPPEPRSLRERSLPADRVQSATGRRAADDVQQDATRTEDRAVELPPRQSGEIKPPPNEASQRDMEEIVPMSLIRRRIGQRLVQAQQQAALLTTFNEVDMSAVIKLRRKFRELFEQRHGVRLGYMPFFVKAVMEGLRLVPELNAELRDDKILYRNYFHIGIAIGSDKGLVVPVLRFAERMSFAEIERAIGDFVRRAADNKLEPQELEGGTFTITNGGVYGSLLSTPIVNPPQSGVLGMHAIQKRPVARGGRVVIRPMMYVALTYDHRMIDGREAILFLRRIKEAIEEPARMLVEV